jgi:hypothetical protein
LPAAALLKNDSFYLRGSVTPICLHLHSNSKAVALACWAFSRDNVKRPDWVPYPNTLEYGHRRILAIDGGGIRGIIVGMSKPLPS